MKEQEEWRPVEGHVGHEVSSLGRVRSFLKWGQPGQYQDTPRLRRIQTHTISDRPHIRIDKVSYFVHALVCRAFHGPRPPGLEASHINGNKLDNRAENLVWETHLENLDRMKAHETRAAGERHGSSKLSQADVGMIRLGYGIKTQQELSDIFGVDESHVSRIVRFKYWR
jgi:hypothetical protein